MKDCRTCPDFFEYTDGFCTMPCKAEKKITEPRHLGVELWAFALFYGSVGAFVGMAFLGILYVNLR